MDVDLGSRGSIRDPAGYFAAARERGGDVQWSAAQRGWALLSHAEVEAAFRDTGALSADRSDTFQRAAARHSPPSASWWSSSAADELPRRSRPPAPARARARRPHAPRRRGPAEIRATVLQALDAFEGDVVELHEAFARPIPALVIATLLGADPQDRPRFQDWSDEIGAIVFSLAPGAVAEGPVVRAVEQFVGFFSRLIERERAAPCWPGCTADAGPDLW
jgi:cytochrome P450